MSEKDLEIEIDQDVLEFMICTIHALGNTNPRLIEESLELFNKANNAEVTGEDIEELVVIYKGTKVAEIFSRVLNK